MLVTYYLLGYTAYLDNSIDGTSGGCVTGGCVTGGCVTGGGDGGSYAISFLSSYGIYAAASSLRISYLYSMDYAYTCYTALIDSFVSVNCLLNFCNGLAIPTSIAGYVYFVIFL
jgi:hypothetical protein